MKATTKTTVKKTTDKKVIDKVVKKKNVPSVKEVKKYTYKNISSETYKEPKKILSFLKKEKLALDRMNERKINIADISKLTKFVQYQYLENKPTFVSVKFIFVLNNKTIKILHFGEKIK